MLFIPVHINNFNNIFSTGSISPPAFYQNRSFGYSRYVTHYMSPFNNITLAYKFLPIDTDRTKPDFRDTFFIALSEKYLRNNLVEDSVVKFFNTVYLSTSFSHIICQSEEQKDMLLAQSLRSLETKFTPLFASFFKLTEDFIDSQQTWNVDLISKINEPEGLLQTEVDKDIRVNKIKGSLYAFFAGLAKESGDDLLLIRRQSKEILNITSSILNELSISINEKSQRNKKKNHDTEIVSRRLSEIEGLINSMLESLKNRTEEDIERAITNYWGDVGALEFLKEAKSRKFFNKTIFDIIRDGFINAEWNEKPIKEELKKFLRDLKYVIKYPNTKEYFEFQNRTYELINHIEMKINKYSIADSSSRKSPNELHIHYNISDDYNHFEVSPNGLSEYEKDIFNSLINTLIYRVKISGIEDFALNREAIITEVGKVLKEQVTYFDGSGEYLYMQNLFRSLKTIGSGFKITDSACIPIQSFAYTISRPNDFDKFHDLMEKNGFGRFGIAYSIMGAAIGLANLPKTFFSELLKEKNDGFNQLLKDFDNIDLQLRFTAENQTHIAEEPDIKNENALDIFLQQVTSLPILKGDAKLQDWIFKCYRSLTQTKEIEGFSIPKDVEFKKNLGKRGKPQELKPEIITEVINLYRSIHE